MKNVVRTLLLAALLLVCGRPLAAQEPTPARLQAAERLVAVMQLESTWAPLTEQFLGQLHRTTADTSRAAAESRASLREMFRTKLSWERVGPEYVRLYASLYAEDELRQLAAFYGSPLGQKSLRLNPVVSARLMEIVQRLTAAPPS